MDYNMITAVRICTKGKIIILRIILFEWIILVSRTSFRRPYQTHVD
jgi:hypothetical protein